MADHLGIGRFAVLGWSGGCAYSLAIARYLDDRVTHGVLVSSPVDDPQVYRLVHWFFIVPGLLRGIPPLQKALPARMSRRAHADLDALVESFLTPHASNPLSEPDRALMRDPTMREQWKANWTEVFRQGPAGVIPDYMAVDRTEGFHVHRGAADRVASGVSVCVCVLVAVWVRLPSGGLHACMQGAPAQGVTCACRRARPQQANLGPMGRAHNVCIARYHVHV